MLFCNKNGASVPRLGLGTYLLKDSHATDTVSKAIEVGYRHIDTAQFYHNEAEVGDGIVSSGIERDKIFLVTKVWPDNLTDENFIPSVEESLKKLKTDHVNLLLIHWPHASLPVESYMPHLVKCQELGYAKHIGVSNFNIKQLESALKITSDIFTNQVEFHPFVNQNKLVGAMNNLHIPLTAYCPIAHARVIGNPILKGIGDKYGKSEAQVCLRWMMQLDDVLAIPKTGNPKRLVENISLFDFELSDSEMQEINALHKENYRRVPDFAGSKFD